MARTDTPDRILEAARDLFVKQGYTATSMRQVAAMAGIRKATIYHHFKDKQAIVMALLRQYLERIDAGLDRVRGEPEPRKLVRAAVEAGLSFLFDSADFLSIVRREVPEGRERFQAGIQSFFKEFMALIGGAVERGVEQGMFRPIDRSHAARVLLNMIQGTFAMVHLGGEPPVSTDAAADSILDVYFRGIDAR